MTSVVQPSQQRGLWRRASLGGSGQSQAASHGPCESLVLLLPRRHRPFTCVYLWLVYISPSVPGFHVLRNKCDSFLPGFSPQANVTTFGLSCAFAGSARKLDPSAPGSPCRRARSSPGGTCPPIAASEG